MKITQKYKLKSYALLYPIYNCKTTPTFAHGLESFAFHLFSELASTLHSPVTMDKIQNTLAISALSNDTIKLALSCFNIATQWSKLDQTM